jgi:outer membrane protein assembly factor BamE
MIDLAARIARQGADGVRYHAAADLSPFQDIKMRKLLICSTLGATLVAAGCSSAGGKSDERGSVLASFPFVYKMTVQQGNIITEEMVDALEPGMTKSQVRYLLGTPLLTDLFHADRWDYVYTIRRGHQEMDVKPFAVFFKDDALVRVEGYIRPDPQRAADRQPQDLLVSVPDWDGDEGFFRKTLTKVGLEPAD